MKSSMHGSPKESGMIHGGKGMVTKQLMVGAGPGIEATKIKPVMAKSQTQGGAATSGKVKGMKTYNQE